MEDCLTGYRHLAWKNQHVHKRMDRLTRWTTATNQTFTYLNKNARSIDLPSNKFNPTQRIFIVKYSDSFHSQNHHYLYTKTKAYSGGVSCDSERERVCPYGVTVRLEPLFRGQWEQVCGCGPAVTDGCELGDWVNVWWTLTRQCLSQLATGTQWRDVKQQQEECEGMVANTETMIH